MSDTNNNENPAAAVGAAANTMFSPPTLAALRNVLSGVGMLLGMVGLGATLSPETIQKIIEVAQQVGVVVGATVALVGTVTPLVMGGIAAFKSTQKEQVKSVQVIATGPASDTALEAQKALVHATAAIAADKSIPKSEEAKQTLIAATIGLDNVQTIVTDKETADAAPSASVVAAEDVQVVKTQ